MKLFKLSQKINIGYDTYDACIVAARNEDDARRMHPRKSEVIVTDLGDFIDADDWKDDGDEYNSRDWANNISEVIVEHIGETHLDSGIVLSSFNAG